MDPSLVFDEQDGLPVGADNRQAPLEDLSQARPDTAHSIVSVLHHTHLCDAEIQ